MTRAAARLAWGADRAVVAVQRFWLTPCAPDFAVALRFALGALGLVQLAARWPILVEHPGALAGYVAGILGMLVGYHTRLFAALAWLGHGAVLGGGRSIDGGDEMMQLLLCYLVFSPAGARWSLDAWLGRVSAAPTAVARIAQRAMQLHLCLIYVDAGLAKVQDATWWIALIELGFVVAIWFTVSRRAALTIAIVVQLGIAIVTRQWLLGLTMIAFHLVAFGQAVSHAWPLLCLSGFRLRAHTHDDAKPRFPEIRCVVVPCGGGEHAARRGR